MFVTPTYGPLRIVFADRDPLVRDLLVPVLEQREEVDLLYHTGDGGELLSYLRGGVMGGTLVLVQPRLASVSGMEVLRELAAWDGSVLPVVWGPDFEIGFTGHFLKMGARAYVPRLGIQELIEVLRRVQTHGHHWTPAQMAVLAQQLSPRIPRHQVHPEDGFTKREAEVLQLLCQQLSIREIADQLFISPKTAETHKANLLLKTGLRNTVGLVLYAIRRGLVDPAGVPLEMK